MIHEAHCLMSSVSVCHAHHATCQHKVFPDAMLPCHVQIFKVQFDVSRSSKFSIAAHFSNLRGILASGPHLERLWLRHALE